MDLSGIVRFVVRWRWRSAAWAIAAVGLASAPARAQSPLPGAFELRMLQTSTSPRSLIVTDLPTITGHLTFSASLFASFAGGTLFEALPPGVAAVRVTDALRAEAQLSLGLFERFELGLAMPVVLQSAPEALDGGRVLRPDNPRRDLSPGDLRVTAKVPLLRGATGLALRVAVSLPTGDDRRFAGSPSWTLTPAVVVGRTAGRWTFAGQLGMTLRERNALAAVEVNDEVLLTAGVGYAVHPRVDLLLDSALRVTVNPSSGRDPQAPFGAWIGAAWRPAAWLALSATAGAGITADVGTARQEVMLGARFTAQRANPCTHGPEDYDGFEDRDFCADPDNDRDGIPDVRDRCPNDAEDRDGVLDDDGCADPDNDGDGVLDDADRCPLEPEDQDRFQNEDGCPEPDNDRDEVLDVRDACPDEPEDRDGYQDEDGCPEPGPEAVVVTRTDSRLLINQRIFFDFDSDTIRNVSFPVLDEVANTIRRNPDILRMRVEGYTDDRGTPEYNLDLSYRRARSVVDYLVARGVDRARLDFAGYGREHSVADNGTPDGQSLNRRVEFTIIGQSTAAPVAAPPEAPAPRAPRRGRHRR
ncbi:MAG: OmpA family protein [Deltaproteobacteria bacterium]|nr:OmpA family protein [Myxococcales bacterium]MDP3218352.1 OmpA family protein [Deltaproteobacteria bacterium]